MQALAISATGISPLSILFVSSNMQRLLGGPGITIKISPIAVALSASPGILFGPSMTRGNPVTKLLSRVYLGFIHIVPQLVLLFFVFFGSARIFGLSLNGEFSSIFVFMLWDTVGMGDLVRSVPESIPGYRYESAAVLGLVPGQYSRYAIVLQTLRRLLPLTTNFATYATKTTSLIVLTGVVEVLETGQQIINADRFQYPTVALPIYGVIFLLCFLVYWPVSMLAYYLERHWVV